MQKRQLPEKKRKQGSSMARIAAGISVRSAASLFLAVTAAFLLATSVWGLARKYFMLRSGLADLRSQHTELQQKFDSLAEKNAFLATSEGEEVALRKKFSIARPGELVVVVAPGSPDVPPKKNSVAGRFWDSIIRGLGL